MARSFITIILLVSSSLLTIFYLQPQWNKFNVMRREVENLNNIASELDEIISKRDSLLESINTISKEDLARIDEALPHGPHAADFLVMLEQVVLQSGLVLKRVEVSSLSNTTLPEQGASSAKGQPAMGSIALSVKQKKATTEFPVSLVVAGSYESFKLFLQNIEHLVRITNVTDVSFSSAEKRDTFEFNVKGETFYQ